MRRWSVVAGALMVQLCLGAIYAWGTFVPILKASRPELALMLRADVLGVDPAAHADWERHAKGLKRTLAESTGEAKVAAKAAWKHYLDDEVAPRLAVPEATWGRYRAGFSTVQTKAIFSTGIAVFALVMTVSGRWQDRAGPRTVALAGCGLLGLGYLVAAAAPASFWWVWAWVGVVGGAGIGCAYVCPIAACLKWFPEAKGPITGLAVAGFGAGAYLFINLAGSWAGLLASGGVPGTFRTFGLIFLAVGGLGSLLLCNPPGHVAARAGEASEADVEPSRMARSGAFRLMWPAFMLSSGGGLMVIGALKDFGVAEGGMSDSAADQALGLLALFNGLGRISWGVLGQWIGVRRALMTLMILDALMLASLPVLGTGPTLLAVGGCWVGFMFGGNLSLFPLLTADRFGLRHMGGNYGLVFTAYGFGGVVGPLLAGLVVDSTGSYRGAFWSAGVASVVAAALIAAMPARRASVGPSSI